MAQRGTPTIYNLYKSEWYKLALNETFDLLDRDGDVFMWLPDELTKWSITLRFRDNRNIFQAAQMSTAFKDDGVILTLENWYGDTPIQNVEPLNIQSVSGNLSLLVIIKTFANRNQYQRSVTISIWKKYQSKEE